MTLDDWATGRANARYQLTAAINRPFDPDGAAAYDAEQARLAWERQYLMQTGDPRSEQVKDEVLGPELGSVG